MAGIIVRRIGVFVLILITLIIFVFYLHFLFKPYCLKLGYTLCAAIGEDFYALYQATYNFFHNIFIYGDLAQQNLVTPYFVIFKYFPAAPLIIGWPFLIFSSGAENAYWLYLYFNICIYFLTFLGLYFLAQRFKVNNAVKLLLFILWFTYFPMLSDLRMGQYDLISSELFLLSLIFIVFNKQITGTILWLASLLFKPLALLNIFYFLKAKYRLAIMGFLIVFVVFTGIYLLYYQWYNPHAINDFMQIILLSKGDRTGWQVHYPDNFSINSLIGEIFFDWSSKLYRISSKIYSIIILGLFMVISYKIKLLNDIRTHLYYSLYAFSTLIMFHKEVWESWLSMWLIIIAVLIILALTKKERAFLFINGLILGTPSLFYFWEKYHTVFWRFSLIFEKTLPQILIYGYLLFILFGIIKKQRALKSNALLVK